MSHIEKALERARKERQGVPEGPRTIKDQEVRSALPLDPVYTETRSVPVEESILVEQRLATLSAAPVVIEQYNILKTKIFQRTRDEHLNTLMVTSVGPGEGKTLTAVNLALSMAREMDQTVLLVDADLRSPAIHNCFGLPSEPGLADYLFRNSLVPDLLVNPGIAKLTIMPAGNLPSHSLEYLSSPRMAALVDEMKERYPDRYVIFDCPPLLGYADSLVFSEYVNGIILVVEAEKASGADIRKALDLLSGRNVIGTVLNRADPAGGKYGYHR